VAPGIGTPRRFHWYRRPAAGDQLSDVAVSALPTVGVPEMVGVRVVRKTDPTVAPRLTLVTDLNLALVPVTRTVRLLPVSALVTL